MKTGEEGIKRLQTKGTIPNESGLDHTWLSTWFRTFKAAMVARLYTAFPNSI